MDAETPLRLLSVLGLTIGLVGGLVSQLTKTSTEIEGTTRKRLTGPGRWAVGISAVGFLGAFTTEMLKASLAAQQRRVAEIERSLQEQRELLHETRLFARLSAATAPLTSVSFRLTIENPPPELRKGIEDALDAAAASVTTDEMQDRLEHHEVSDVDARALQELTLRSEGVQPLLNLLGRSKFSNGPAVLGIALDQRHLAMAAFGWVNRPDVIPLEGKTTPLPAGILVADEARWGPSWVARRVRDRRFGHSIDF